MQRPKKRSLTLNGHRTSVSLEDEFWLEFLRIAQEQGKAINALAVEIDYARGVDTVSYTHLTLPTICSV